MNITYSRKVVKVIGTLDSTTKQRLRNAIEKLPNGDVKQIQRGDITTYRLRVGGWRVLYSMNEEDIFIEKIAPRGQVYKGV